jgi:hypothetical protein
MSLTIHVTCRYEYLSNEKAEKDKTDCITEDSKGQSGYQNKEAAAITPWCPGTRGSHRDVVCLG